MADNRIAEIRAREYTVNQLVYQDRTYLLELVAQQQTTMGMWEAAFRASQKVVQGLQEHIRELEAMIEEKNRQLAMKDWR